MKIAIGSDHNGYDLKEIIRRFLEENNIEVVDYGCKSNMESDYPDVAFAVANDIRAGKFERGILICGTGIGVAISANKVPGVRAAQCHDTYSAERARKSNNAQIMTLGGKVIGTEIALKIVQAWLESEFQGGNSDRKVKKIIEFESKFLGGDALEKTDKQSEPSC